MSDNTPRPAIPIWLLTEAAMSKRSSLYRWMAENHDMFAEVLRKAGRPNWEALAKTLGEQGLSDAGNKPPSEETTRQTWWKVRKAMKARRDRRPPPQPQLPSPQRPDPVRAPAVSTDLDTPAAPDDDAKIVLRRVTTQQ
jgi:hypothetical protein